VNARGNVRMRSARVRCISLALVGSSLPPRAASARRALGYHREMRSLKSAALAALVALATLATPSTARAEIGIGLFIGEPLGFDLKIDLARRQALDIVLGGVSYRDGDRGYSYGHLTYLVTPFVGRGRSVLVPLRFGIGGAVFGVFEEEFNLAGRVPFEIGLLFRSAPIEIYGEIALRVTLISEYGDEPDLEADGGIGIRFYF
jgi:hypothetical protein